MEKGPNFKSKSQRPSKPKLPPLPVAGKSPVKSDLNSNDACDINDIGGTDSGFDFELNRQNILNGIIFAEIFGKPKGRRRYR